MSREPVSDRSRYGRRAVIAVAALGACLLLWRAFGADTHRAATVTPAVVVADGIDEHSLRGHVEIVEDAGGAYTLERLLRGPAPWVISSSDNPGYGFTRSVYWERLTVSNPGDARAESILSLRYPLLDHVDVYVERTDGGFDQHTSGDRLPFAEREIADRHLAFPVTTEPGQTQRIFLRVQTDSSMQLGLRLQPRDRFIGSVTSEQGLRGMYYGVMAVMALYNLILFVAIRTRAYVYYVLYVVAIAMVHVMLDGSAARWLFPGSPELANTLTPLSYVNANLWPVVFVRSFLDTRRNVPRLDRLLFGYCLFLVAVGGFTIFAPYAAAVRVAAALSAVTALLCYSAGVVMLRKGYRPARFYLLSWGSVMVAVIIFVLASFGVIAANAFTVNIMMIGSAIEVVLLCLALGDQINLVRRESAESRANAVALEKDLALTGAVQQLFLPKSDTIQFGELSLAGFYRPAAICGGDWWWYERCADGRLILLLGDVTGHGAGAAMVTAAIAATYQASTERDADARAVLETLHASLQRICRGSYCMSMAVVEIDPGRREVTLWSAGAPALLVQHADGRIESVAASGTPIGGAELVIGEARCLFGPGDRLFAFSDGLNELVTANGRVLGYRGAGKLLVSTQGAPVHDARRAVAGVLDDVHGTRPLLDDVTFVLVDHTTPP
jgi:two-component system, sensor histidine kinase LadS